jgi:hypothetical protein
MPAGNGKLHIPKFLHLHAMRKNGWCRLERIDRSRLLLIPQF